MSLLLLHDNILFQTLNTLEDLQSSMEPARYVGRAPIQVTKFIEQVLRPVLKENEALLGVKAEINV